MSAVKCLISVVCVFLVPVLSSGQGLAGKDFLFAIPQNFRSTSDGGSKHPEYLVATISAVSAADVELTSEGIGWTTTVHVDRGTAQHVDIPESLVANRTGIGSKTIRIRSTSPVVISITYSKYQTTESTSLLPSEMCGRDYWLASYSPMAQDLISTATVAAYEDFTSIKVTFRDGETREYALQAGQCAVIARDTNEGLPAKDPAFDLTGVHVLANRKISVMSSHRCAYIPEKVEACNYLLEHTPPYERLGTDYVIPAFPGRLRTRIRIIGTRPETNVTVNADSTEVHVLGQGEFKEIASSVPIRLRASNPVLVAMYSEGFKSETEKDGNLAGDPCMILVPPVNRWTRSAIVNVSVARPWTPTLVIVTRPEALPSLTVNGSFIEDPAVVNIGTDLVQLNVPMTGAEATISSGYNMLVLATAQSGNLDGSYDAYGHVASW